MSIFNELLSKKEILSVIGLGYVGMPIAVAFSKQLNVIGFDINKEKIELYRSGVDPTHEVGDDAIKESKMLFTFDESQIRNAKFHIIAVPTPINQDKTPNLNPVVESSKIVGRNLTKGSYIVYESTVYPGVTEDICVPILEKESGLKSGTDFKVGYSPERINPGDKINTLESIMKIVSGQDEETTNEIAKIYELVIKAGIHKASSIRVAEAAKVVENSQRDINIAFMNELAMVFDRMGIDTNEVVKAMNTKWNALGFTPGLVGGHCIGVDPYYFVYEAEKLGYHSQIVLSGRKINDSVARFVTENIIKKLIQSDIVVRKAKITILGITFKENCPDIRNSKVNDIVHELRSYGIEPIVIDPYANSNEVFHEYGITLSAMSDAKNSDALVFAVAHDEYKSMTHNEILPLYKNPTQKILIDIKSMFTLSELIDQGYRYWRL
ncbi:UDP-N-acetyl-D-galactosamine dehydrogenase [Candidatus Izimaplasma bacterium ZiA1]|uniref:nucleotide sugar dehydrogenase n=1 Tax=Candidatus Izimoplasma sp. ZiA1 TaxID=2024899 RepID=UPI000BAA78BC|nr:UDP-N-acetyl-D-galactosamine dehydrogenase [Candidatus Izimaplasma bacterium ZiA1]